MPTIAKCGSEADSESLLQRQAISIKVVNRPFVGCSFALKVEAVADVQPVANFRVHDALERRRAGALQISGQ